MSKGKSEFANTRNLELLNAFHKALLNPDVLSASELIRIAAASPCSQFWVSVEQAARVISNILRGIVSIDELSLNKREMYQEIMRRCKGDYSIRRIEQVVYSDAPKFYLTYKSAKVIIYRMRRQRRKGRKL